MHFNAITSIDVNPLKKDKENFEKCFIFDHIQLNPNRPIRKISKYENNFVPKVIFFIFNGLECVDLVQCQDLKKTLKKCSIFDRVQSNPNQLIRKISKYENDFFLKVILCI